MGDWFLRMAAAVCAAWAALAVAAPASAQVGAEPLRIVFPFAAGGSGDALARLLAEHLRTALGQPVIVENRTGAQGRIGVQAVKAAAASSCRSTCGPVDRATRSAPASLPRLLRLGAGAGDDGQPQRLVILDQLAGRPAASRAASARRP